MRSIPAFVGASLLVLACKDEPPPAEEGETSGGIGVEESDSGPKLDLGGGEGSDDMVDDGCAGDGNACSGRVDLLFVIDNSGSMGEEQRNLARNLPLLVQQIEQLTGADGNPVTVDLHIMVTTTDSGNPLCDPFYPAGRMAEMGSPIASPCTDRIDRFTSVDFEPVVMEQACTDSCPNPVAPDGNYIQSSISGDNIPDVDAVDVNGDGIEDSALAQALACVGPQGIDGCGYERPLDSMRSALDPDAEWNGSGGFLRSGGLLAVVVMTDEADCSIANDSVMSDTSYMETNPGSGMPVPTSAVCWNAGVSCDGPDGNGVYDKCTSSGEGLTAINEYIDFLQGIGKPVVMLGILGVPEVTAHSETPPYVPTEGGVEALVYRDWRDPDYPNGGDILPDAWADGDTAEVMNYRFGIGPGCTGIDDNGDYTGQAIPPVRVKEVCQALDVADNPDTNENEAQVRCCIESICDTDFSDAIRCLGGLIETNFVPEG